MNKFLKSTVILSITTCILITQFESCITSLDPLAMFVELSDLNYFLNHPTKRPNSTLSVQQNSARANEYAAQGILKMNSIDTNDLKLARRYFYASLSFDESSPQVWGYLGNVSMKEYQLNKSNSGNEKLVNAVYYYNKAIELDGMNDSFYFERATCYYAMGDTAYLADYRKSCDLGNAKACSVIK